MNLRHIFRIGLRWSIGNGASVSFWFDNWLYSFPIASIFPPILGSRAIYVNFFINEGHSWNIQLLLQYVSADIVTSISGIFLPSDAILDKIVWGHSVDGEYSVKTGVALIQNGSSAHVPPNKNCWMWKLKVPPKI